MFDIKFTPRGSKEFKRLPQDWRVRLTKKLKYFASQQEPIKLAKPLTNLLPATKLSVPVVVDLKLGPNWGEMKPLKSNTFSIPSKLVFL